MALSYGMPSARKPVAAHAEKLLSFQNFISSAVTVRCATGFTVFCLKLNDE